MVCAFATHPLAQTAPVDSAPAPSSSALPSAAAAPAQPPNDRDPSLGPVQTRPFGPGTIVTIECDKPWVYAFVAQGAVDDRPAFPDPFVKVGRLPVAIELPPGTYTLIADGESAPSATRVFRVDRTPVRVRVKAGSQGMRTAGTLLTALGGLAVAAGLVVELSGTKDQDTSKRNKLAIPLLVGGGIGFAGGLTMFFVSKTTMTDDGPAASAEADHGVQSYRGIQLSGVF